MMKRFPYILTALAILAFTMLTALGVWQMHRLQWKAGLIAAAEGVGSFPPVPVETLRSGDLVDFRHVVLTCPGLATAPFVELQTIFEGRAGVRVISACRVASIGGYLLVDRGFIEDAVSSRPPVQTSDVPVRIVGQYREVPTPRMWASYPAEPPTRFYQRDEGWMGMALKVYPVKGTVFAATSSNPEWLALKPSVPPAAFSNNHLGYALTWFGLAITLVAFYIVLLRRRMNGAQPDDRKTAP